MSWLPESNPEGFSIFDEEFVANLDEINSRKDDESAAKRSTTDCEFTDSTSSRSVVLSYSHLLEDKDSKIYVVNFSDVTRIHMPVWRLCELLHEDVGLSRGSVERIISDFRECVSKFCPCWSRKHKMHYRHMWFDYWFRKVYWPAASRRIFLNDSHTTMLRAMEIFGFDVQRVRDILEIQCYVPTARRDVDFWVLNYLSCKLMGYVEGTSSVLLHAAGRW